MVDGFEVVSRAVVEEEEVDVEVDMMDFNSQAIYVRK